MKPTVVLLLSDKRSGSTILQRELCKVSQVQHVAYSPHTYFETQFWVVAASLLGMPGIEFYGGKPYYRSRRSARRLLIDCVIKNCPDFRVPDTDQDLVFQGWEELCRKYAQPVFFEKSPHHANHWAALSLLLQWVKQTTFDVKIIALVRNPMSVLYSAKRLFLSNPDQRQYLWAETYRNVISLREMIGEDRFYLLRYEDLINSPTKHLQNICRSLGIECPETIGEDIHIDSQNRWRADPEFALTLSPSVTQVAECFGYSHDDLFNPGKPRKAAFTRAYCAFTSLIRRTRWLCINRAIKPSLMTLKSLVGKNAGR